MTDQHKNALVTGAAARIGAQFARDLANEGWGVVVHYSTSSDRADKVVADINSGGGRAVAVQADLSSADETEHLIAASRKALGDLTLLVNNASRFENDDAVTFDVDEWNRHHNINLRAPAILARDFAQQLPQGASGNIINLIDQRVWRPNPKFFTYASSKAGLWAITQTLAQALAPRIRVNAIGPGPALASARMSADEFAKQCRLTPLQVGTSPSELSRALMFILASPAMTGQMIALDGGQHLAWQTPDVVEVDE